MKKTAKKTTIESSKVSAKNKSDAVHKESEQSEEIVTDPSESVEVVEDARVNEGKKRGLEKNDEATLSESDSEIIAEISDKKPDAAESSDVDDEVSDKHAQMCIDEKEVESANGLECEESKEVASISEESEDIDVIEPPSETEAPVNGKQLLSENASELINVNDEITAEALQMTDEKEEVESASCELLKEDNIAEDSSTESSEVVLNDTSTDIENPVAAVSTDLSKCSSEISEEVTATSEESKEVTTDTSENDNEVISECRKHDNDEISGLASEVSEDSVSDEEAKTAIKRSRLEVMDTGMDDTLQTDTSNEDNIDDDSTATESPEDVMKETSTDIENPVADMSTDQSKCSDEVSEKLTTLQTATSEELKEVTTDASQTDTSNINDEQSEVNDEQSEVINDNQSEVNDDQSEVNDDQSEVNDKVTVELMQITDDKEEVDSEEKNEDNITTLDNIDQNSVAVESSEGVLNYTPVDISEDTVATETFNNINGDVNKGRKRENIDVNTPSSENTDDDEAAKIANKRSKLEVTDASGKSDESETDKFSRKIFVGGLSFNITEDKLRIYFETYGHVVDVDVIRDRYTNRSRGFAFVVFEKEESANNCIQKRTHVICQKICEAKKVTKSRFISSSSSSVSSSSSSSSSSRHSSGYNNRKLPQIQQRNAGFDLPQMFNQAFLIGRLQQRARQPSVMTSPSFLQNRGPITNHLPTSLINPIGTVVQPNYNNIPRHMAKPISTVFQHNNVPRSLVNQVATSIQPTNNILLQALINRQMAPSTHIGPMVALASAPNVPMFAPILPTSSNTAALNLLAHKIRGYPQNN